MSAVRTERKIGAYAIVAFLRFAIDNDELLAFRLRSVSHTLAVRTCHKQYRGKININDRFFKNIYF
ncbi:MAG: hypothetical protein ABFD45_04685 [Smithella sp.]